MSLRAVTKRDEYHHNMTTATFDDDLDLVLRDRRLLEHPFYRRWERGEVSTEELASYAAQYRHFEEFLPKYLARLVAVLPDGPTRELVAANLADELGDPVPHVEMFGRFAHAVGATEEPPSSAIAQLLKTYEDLLSESPAAALAGFVAYESQSSGIAQTKAAGLRRDHGLSEYEVSFWTHHAEIDVRHGEWARHAVDAIAGDPNELRDATRRAADAWWAFLDERELAA